MSEQAPNVEEPEWPTHCPHCGHELQQTEVAVIPGGDEQLDTVVAEDRCPNPDCPGRAGADGDPLG